MNNEKAFISVVGDNLLKTFDNVLVINPIKDEVYYYNIQNNYVKFNTKKSFMNFIEEEKKLIHADYLDNYISILSSFFEDKTCLTYKYKSGFSYQDYFLVAKKMSYNNEDIIIVMSSLIKNFKDNSVSSFNSDINKLVDDISDTILKIYNTIDVAEKENPAYLYIKSLLENLTKNYSFINDRLTKNMINEVNKSKSSLLIVDDDIITRNLLKKTFESDFNIVTANNGKEAIDLLNDNYNSKNDEVINFVGIFLDIAMPVLDGFAVLDFLKDKGILGSMPIIIISAADDKETRARVYSYNIADMLEKPFNLDIIKLRINNFINLYRNSNNLTNLIINKDKDVVIILDKLLSNYRENHKDNIESVSYLTKVLANKYLEENPSCGLNSILIEKLGEAVKYFNIGKILLPEKLLISGNFTIDEERVYKEHTINGAILIKRYFANNPDSVLGEYAYNIALSHHENYDGSGYPKMLAGNAIPIYVQISSLVIIYNCCYREKKMNHKQINNIIINSDGKQFSSELVNAFKLVSEDFMKYYEDIK